MDTDHGPNCLHCLILDKIAVYDDPAKAQRDIVAALAQTIAVIEPSEVRTFVLKSAIKSLEAEVASRAAMMRPPVGRA